MWMQNLGLFLLRLFPSMLLIIGHGWPKMMQFSVMRTQFPDPIGLGSTISLILTIIIEVFCPLFLILGIGTRINAALIAILMLVAAFIVHALDPWEMKEVAILYALPYIVIMLTGAGQYSIDHKKGILF